MIPAFPPFSSMESPEYRGGGIVFGTPLFSSVPKRAFRGHPLPMHVDNRRKDKDMQTDTSRASVARQGSPFLTTKDAAHYLSLSSRTLEKMRLIGHGPRFRKHGRYVRYHINDLEQWSEGRGHQSTSDAGEA